MTKLMEWMLGFGTVAAVWITIIFRFVEGISDTFHSLVMPLPIILVTVFGLVSILVILYRVATFNDCVEAAEELKQQIQEAKKDLSSKGMTFPKS